MRTLPAIALGLGLCAGAHAETVDFRCLASSGAGKPIQLQFDFPANDKAAGFVTYRHGNGRIPVHVVARKEARNEEAGRPSEFTTTWKEAGAGGGVYTVVSQGARIYGFTYRRAQDGKTFAFDEDLDATGDDACAWNASTAR